MGPSAIALALQLLRCRHFFDLRGGLWLRLTDRFLITDESAGFRSPSRPSASIGWENILDAGADYTVRERYTFDVNYRWFLVDYKDDPEFDQLDRDDHTIAGTFFYRIFPKTSVLGEVQYNLVRYDEPAVAADRDSDAARPWRPQLGRCQ